MIERGVLSFEVEIPAGSQRLEGSLWLPEGCGGLVIFAHGSGSSRFSPRNRAVARFLNRAGFGTLLFDLLTAEEEERERYTRHLRFDIGLLAGRLAEVTEWVEGRDETQDLTIAYFGSSTGAAAALVAAADRPDVKAVVSRGGRPDLAGDALPQVRAATLLLVGERDDEVLALNREAYEALTAVDKALHVIPGATHLFEEPGTLDEVMREAAGWLTRYLGAPAQLEPAHP